MDFIPRQVHKKFEVEFSKFIGVSHAVSCSNGTLALHLALVALGIVPGDEVIVPSLIYIASVSTIVITGATPIFLDSLEDTRQLEPKHVEKKITSKTKVIMAVHLYGHPCDMDSLVSIAKKYNLSLIEDCAEAFSSKFKDKNVRTFGDISSFSFYGNNISVPNK